jgi:hypothetical protein
MTKFFINNLFDQQFLDKKIDSILPKIDNINEKFDFCEDLFFNNTHYNTLTESSVQNIIILPIIKKLNWFYALEEMKIISGIRQKLDIILFSTKTAYENYIKIDKNQRHSEFTDIDIILEFKLPTIELDNNKASKETNPYFQILDYLQKSKLNRGFLTNGRHWYLVDNSYVSKDKKYLAFFLDKILEEKDLKSFELFWRLFHANNYIASPETKTKKIDVLAQKEKESLLELESDLRNLIYGSEGQCSLFETIGRSLFEANDRRSDAESLKLVFENSLYFLFRLMFIAYYESRCRTFLDNHLMYQNYSLKKIISSLIEFDSTHSNGWGMMKLLFNILDQGNTDLRIFLLDGGLFNTQKTPLLSKDAVFNNKNLKFILDKLFILPKDSDSINTTDNFIRDFSVFSPAHLGTIYEGLLEFEFRIAEEDLFYAISNVDKNKVEGYYDKYDIDMHKNQLNIIKKYKKGDLYLVNSLNNRKVSGSYYTPDSLAFPLVSQGVERQLEGLFKDHSILDLRVLDCACGSGHLLIVALNVLANKALDQLNVDKELKRFLDQELEAIRLNYKKLGLDPTKIALDEFTVLKRLLLKKTIYGVDYSPFAVELTQLALWLDTFIYGTPLSFIEHHIKCGNSLIGSDTESLTPENKQDIFENNIRVHLSDLIDKIISLNFLNDSTKEEIIKSKDKFYNQILPLTNEINEYIDFINYLDILKIKNISPLPPIFPKLNAVFLGQTSRDMTDEQLAEKKREAGEFRKFFGFFNWKVEFPEVFSSDNYAGPGFHLIVGNPPWDKTKFEEPLFFSQYRSNYRTLSNNRKEEIAADLLAKPDIREKYEREKERIEVFNSYLKLKFPLNKGAGDNNLFRFFVEKALSLLAPRGVLSYVLPTGLLTEDGSFELRKHIFKKFHLVSFDGFENRKRVFPDVDSRYKFGLIQIENMSNQNQITQTRFMLTDPESLKTNEGRFPYSLSDIKLTSPNHLAFLDMPGGEKDLKILKKLYSKFPPLNPKWLDLGNELHATNDKKIFLEERKTDYLPLYKGEMIWQFQAQIEDVGPQYWLDPVVFDEYLLSSRISRLKKDLKSQFSLDLSLKKTFKAGFDWPKILNFLKLSKDEDLKSFIAPERDFPRLAIRAIASDTNERTLIAALLPCDIGAQNSLWLSIAGRYTLDLENRAVLYEQTPLTRLLLAQALFNSLTVDWILRASVAMNVNKTYLFRLPIPQPSDQELVTNQQYIDLIHDSALLSLYHCPSLLAEIKNCLDLDVSELIQTSKAFDLRKAALDLKVARLYGLTDKEISTILDNFKVLKTKKSHYYNLIMTQITNH